MIRDDFAGPGGVDEGLRMLGLVDVVGVEYDETACATAVAAGHRRVCADVSAVPSEPWAGLDGYWASPPCTTFSLAGLGGGRSVMGLLVAGIRAMAEPGADPRPQLAEDVYRVLVRPIWQKKVATYRAALKGERLAAAKRPTKAGCEAAARVSAKTTILVLEPVRVVRDLRPRWVAMEQVPPVLPLWQVIAEVYRGWGYSVTTGLVNAADVGVPQTRTRAFLAARSDGVAVLPSATHAPRAEETLFGQLAKYVSMAEALGWGRKVPSWSIAPGTANGGTDPAAMGGSGTRRAVAAERDAGDWVDHPDDDPDGWTVEYQRGAGFLERGGDRRRHPVEEPSPTIRAGGPGNGGCGPNLILHPPELNDPASRAADPPSLRSSNRPGDARRGGENRRTEVPGDEPAPTIDCTGNQAWVEPAVVRTNNFTAVARDEDGRRTKRGSVPYERSVDEPAPTVDTSAGGWEVGDPTDEERPPSLRVNTGRDWKEGGTREDAQSFDPAEQPAPAIDTKGRWQVAEDPSDVTLRTGFHTRGYDRSTPRTGDDPAPTVTFGHDAARWTFDRPATTVVADGRLAPPVHHGMEGMRGGGSTDLTDLGHGDDLGDLAVADDPEHWAHNRPSTTIVGSFNPDVVAPPGWRMDPLKPRQDTPGSVRISPQQAAVLQGFPATYPWQGNQTKVFEQIGNAVPPRMAAAVVGALLGLDWPSLLG